MHLDHILDHWREDSQIDPSELSSALLAIPQLHNKYYKLYLDEKLKQRQLERQLERLKLDKYEFYTQGPSTDEHDKWELPAIGRVIKSEASTYVSADRDVSELALRVGAQSDKVGFLESIIKHIRDRGFIIKSMIDYEKFKAGY